MAKRITVINGKGDFTATPPTGVDTGDWMSLESILIADEGVINVSGDKLLVRELAAPSMKVRVNPGQCYIENSDFTADSLQNKYFLFKMDSEEELDISSNASGSTRIDLICAEVDKVTSPDNTGANVALLTVVEGTPGAGVPATPDDHLKLAEVEVGDGVTSITDSDITDSRVEVVLDIDRLPVLDEDDMASDSATALATQQSIKAYVDGSGYGGWLTQGLTGVAVTRESTDNPTVVLRFDADVRDYIWKGMRIRATENSIVHYFIVSADPSFSGGNTDVTCLSEIDTSTPTQAKNLIGATTISDVAYAPPKTLPKGFPISPESWELRTVDGANRSQSSPTQNTWYNLNSFSLSVPIGDWDLGYKVNLGVLASGDVLVDAQSTLSTADNTESDANYTYRLLGGKTASNSNGLSPTTFFKKVSLASKTPYYLNTRTTVSGMSQVNNRGDAGNTIIRATSTLL